MSRLRDGHSTTIEFLGPPPLGVVTAMEGIIFWEIEVTPPGMDAGGPNDTSTMRNVRLRTRQPKKLVTLTAMTVRVAYDPIVFSNARLSGYLGFNQIVRVTFPDGQFISFWGWLDKFVPDRNREGEQPTAEMTIEPSNQDTLYRETLIGINTNTPPLAA